MTKLGNVVSKYKTNQQGKTYLYDKYNHVVGYFKAVSKYKTMLYDKDGTPLDIFLLTAAVMSKNTIWTAII